MKIFYIIIALLLFSCSNKYEVKITYDNYEEKNEIYESENDSTAYLDGLEKFIIREEAAKRTYNLLKEKLKEKGLPYNNLNVNYPSEFKVKSLVKNETININDFNYNESDIKAITEKFKND